MPNQNHEQISRDTLLPGGCPPPDIPHHNLSIKWVSIVNPIAIGFICLQ